MARGRENIEQGGSAGKHGAGRENIEQGGSALIERLPSAGKHVTGVAGAARVGGSASKSPFTPHRGNLKTDYSVWNRVKCFLSTLHVRRRNLKLQQLCLRETWSGNSIDNCDAGHHFRKAPFQKFSVHTKKRKVGIFKFLRLEERF